MSVQLQIRSLKVGFALYRGDVMAVGETHADEFAFGVDLRQAEELGLQNGVLVFWLYRVDLTSG